MFLSPILTLTFLLHFKVSLYFFLFLLFLFCAFYLFDVIYPSLFYKLINGKFFFLHSFLSFFWLAVILPSPPPAHCSRFFFSFPSYSPFYCLIFLVIYSLISFFLSFFLSFFSPIIILSFWCSHLSFLVTFSFFIYLLAYFSHRSFFCLLVYREIVIPSSITFFYLLAYFIYYFLPFILWYLSFSIFLYVKFSLPLLSYNVLFLSLYSLIDVITRVAIRTKFFITRFMRPVWITSWCNRDRCWKWTRWRKFKTWTREAICISHSINTLEKGMHATILLPVMSNILGQTGFFNKNNQPV